VAGEWIGFGGGISAAAATSLSARGSDSVISISTLGYLALDAAAASERRHSATTAVMARRPRTATTTFEGDARFVVGEQKVGSSVSCEAPLERRVSVMEDKDMIGASGA